jgi:hypothetical protein
MGATQGRREGVIDVCFLNRLKTPKERSAKSASASVGRAERIMRSNSRAICSGWMRGSPDPIPVFAPGIMTALGDADDGNWLHSWSPAFDYSS